MSLYADSSALLRRYVDEPDSDAADAMLRSVVQRAGGPAVAFLTFDVRRAQAARALGSTVLGA